MVTTPLLCAVLLTPSAGARAAAPPGAVVVRVRAAAADGLWRATYRFSRAVDRFTFHRERRLGRAPAWRVETPGFAFISEGGREAVAALPAARPRREVTIAFPVDTTHLEKDYQLFERFSDGGLLLYTGHLNVEPGAGPGDGSAPAHRFVLEPRPGEHLVVGGRRYRRRVEWADTTEEGTFVYFGRIEPLQTSQVMAVLDPALPPWMAGRLRKDVPALFADYARLTGFALEERPILLVSFRAADQARATSWKGGTLRGLIQMHLETGAEAPEEPALLRRFYEFLAHEAAHMWNGQLFHSEGRLQSWMHEGGADAFALRALRRAGLLDDRGLEDAQAEDVNDCLARLGREPLRAVEERRDFRAVYTCGSALAWLTEEALRRVEPASDLHGFWAALFREALPRGHAYDEALYLALMRERGIPPGTVAFVDAFVHEPMPDRAARTIAAFAAAGIRLAARPEAMPSERRRDWAVRALAAVMRADCGGRYSIDQRADGFVVNGRPSCATFKKESYVDALDGHVLETAGDAAYDAVAARCRAAQPVPVTVRAGDAPLPVPCSLDVPDREPWLAVVRD